MKDFSNAPLLEGKSVLSDELCGPFRREMDKLNGMYHTYKTYNTTNSNNGSSSQKQVISYKELWRDENLGDFESLRAIRSFVDNCHMREDAAKQMVGYDGGSSSDGVTSAEESRRAAISAQGILLTPDLDYRHEIAKVSDE